MQYSFGLRGHDIGDNFEEMCINAKNANITKLQFAMAKTVNDINFDEVGYNSELSAKIKAQLDSYNLEVSVLGCYINPVCPDKEVLNKELTRFKNFLHYAKDFGAGVVGTETGWLPSLEEAHSEENYLTLVENLRPLVAEAEKLGVTIGIEPVYVMAINSPQRMKRLLDDLNSDSVGVILDVSNLTYPPTRYMQCDIINDSFDLFGDKIKAIHLKDFVFDGDQKSFAIAGSGELMCELIFDRISMLNHTPDIILDETKLSLYEESLASLQNLDL